MAKQYRSKFRYWISILDLYIFVTSINNMKKITFAFLLTILLFACKKEEPSSNFQKVPISDTDTLEIVEMSTPEGVMYIWLYPETPKHKQNFLKLAKEGFYNDLLFHRIIPNFMIQGGDPVGDGTGGPGYTIDAEIFPEIKHKKGSIAAARLGDSQNPEKKSSGSQFYISVSTSGTAQLDGNYTVFGEVIKGIEAADKIVVKPRNQRDKPLTDVPMQVRVLQTNKQKLKDDFGFTP